MPGRPGAPGIRPSGHYSNPRAALEAVLRCPSGGSRSRQRGPDAVLPESKRLGNGVIQRAVIRALAEADGMMDVGETHAAVEVLLGRTVSRDLVGSCLSLAPVRLGAASSG